MIDPKINLRVTPETDMELLELAAQSTRRGLGFPQYSNDTVVIPGLVRHGYDPEDARDYTVAACWEYIIPGKGMDVVNIGAVLTAGGVHQGIVKGLRNGESFERILAYTAADIDAQVNSLADAYRRLLLPPAPYYSVLMEGCLDADAICPTGSSTTISGFMVPPLASRRRRSGGGAEAGL